MAYVVGLIIAEALVAWAAKRDRTRQIFVRRNELAVAVAVAY